MALWQENLEAVKEILKFKTYGKSIMDGLQNYLTEKVDLNLLSEFRKDYTLKAAFDLQTQKVVLKQNTTA